MSEEDKDFESVLAALPDQDFSIGYGSVEGEELAEGGGDQTAKPPSVMRVIQRIRAEQAERPDSRLRQDELAKRYLPLAEAYSEAVEQRIPGERDHAYSDSALALTVAIQQLAATPQLLPRICSRIKYAILEGRRQRDPLSRMHRKITQDNDWQTHRDLKPVHFMTLTDEEGRLRFDPPCFDEDIEYESPVAFLFKRMTEICNENKEIPRKALKVAELICVRGLTFARDDDVYKIAEAIGIHRYKRSRVFETFRPLAEALVEKIGREQIVDLLEHRRVERYSEVRGPYSERRKTSRGMAV